MASDARRRSPSLLLSSSASQPPATKQRDVTPSSARRPAHNTASPLTSSRTASAAAAAAQLSLFQARPATGSDSPAARRSGRARSKSPRQVLECVCLVPGGGGIVEAESLALETRPPVEGRDSLSVEHVLDTASASVEDSLSGELKTACYVPPTQCSVAVRRAVEPTLVTRGTSPMSTSDMDVLPDTSSALCVVPCRAVPCCRTPAPHCVLCRAVPCCRTSAHC